MAQVLSNSNILGDSSKNGWCWNESPLSRILSSSFLSFDPSTRLPMSRTRDNAKPVESKRKNRTQPSKSANKQNRSAPTNPETSRSRTATNVSSKRAQHLERNRVAANKCRLKKKREQEAIQRFVQDESAKQEALLAEINHLNEEVWCLKNKMFQHAVCDDEKIKVYLAGMTNNVLSRRPSDATTTDTTPPLSAASASFSDESLVPGYEICTETGDIGPKSWTPIVDSPGGPILYDTTGTDNLFDTFIDAGNA